MENFFSAKEDLEIGLPLAQKRTPGRGAGHEEIKFPGTPSMKETMRREGRGNYVNLKMQNGFCSFC